MRTPAVEILTGDAEATLRTLPAASCHMCVTSPPFFGLRDYGTGTWEGGDEGCDHDVRRWEGAKQTQGAQSGHASKVDKLGRRTCPCGARRIDQQIGLEATVEEWVGRLVGVFREVGRVLRPDGTLWLEVGDSYAAKPGGPQGSGGQRAERSFTATGRGSVPDGLKPKDLVGAPWLLARALRDPYYAGRIKSETDRAWLAAMLDGEGCIAIHRRPAGQKAYTTYERKDGTKADYRRTADTFQPKVEITNTSLAIIERIVALTGEGNANTKQEAGALTEAAAARAYLTGADLTGADLTRADLAGADLTRADLAGADLTGARGLVARRVSDLHMLYDQPGQIVAYKLVGAKGEGPFNGGIRYEPGGSYEVPDADTDETRDCAAGINLATLPWCCQEWRPGYRILRCEFAAGDIAAIPVGGGGKFRVRRCTVVGEVDLAELGLADTPNEEA